MEFVRSPLFDKGLYACACACVHTLDSLKGKIGSLTEVASWDHLTCACVGARGRMCVRVQVGCNRGIRGDLTSSKKCVGRFF